MNASKSNSAARLSILIAVLLAALLPSAASAGNGKAEFPLPKPETTKIKIPDSLGGVSLGQTPAETAAQWGGKGVCKNNYCHWGPNNYAYKGEAGIGFEDGVVNSAGIRWSPQFSDGKRAIRRSITKFHTAEGIHLKSTAKQTKKAYPDQKLIDVGNNDAFKFDGPDSTMYIHVGRRFVERIEIRPPGFSYAGE